MKRLFCCAVVSTFVAVAQTTPDQELAFRMAGHLLAASSALALPDPIHDEVYSLQEVKSLSTPSLRKVMDAYQNDLRQVVWMNTDIVQRPDEATPALRLIPSPDQAYKLAHSLVSREVTQASLTPLCAALISLVKEAVQCRNDGCDFRKDRSGRDAAETVQTELQSIGIRDAELKYVMNSILRDAIAVSAPPFRTFYR